MYLKTRDYTVWMKESGGEKRYFIKYRGQTDSPTCEISLEVFTLYVEEFYKPLEKQRNEHRRHLEDGSLEHFDMAGELASRTADAEDRRVTMYAVEAVLKTCTPIQQKRFRLHFVEGYTLEEIAVSENCGKPRIKKSVDAVMEKVKKYFS